MNPSRPGGASLPARPRWVGLAARLMTDAGEPVLRLEDPAHARLLRQMGARGLHEPLLATLPVGAGSDHGSDTGPGENGAGPPLVALAGQALRALLPGNPKPVAALTRAPEVVALLLRALDAGQGEVDAAREELAAAVLFSLALSSALHGEAVVQGPCTLRHSATRRGLALADGQRLRLTPSALWLDGRQVDPWGPELGGLVSSVGPYAALRSDLSRLPDAATLAEAQHRMAPVHPERGTTRELFDALECDQAPTSAASGPTSAQVSLPLAVGSARLPPHATPDELARALLREGVLHRLTLLRLVDPLVEDERALGPLAALADTWACARLGLAPAPLAAQPADLLHSLTPLGRRALEELDTSSPAALL